MGIRQVTEYEKPISPRRLSKTSDSVNWFKLHPSILWQSS